MLQYRSQQQADAVLQVLGAVEHTHEGELFKFKTNVLEGLTHIAQTNAGEEDIATREPSQKVEQTDGGWFKVKDLRGFTLRRAQEEIDKYAAAQQEDPTTLPPIDTIALESFIEEQLAYQREKMAELTKGSIWEPRARTDEEIAKANGEIKETIQRRRLAATAPFEAQIEGNEVTYRYSVFSTVSKNLAENTEKGSVPTHTVSIKQKVTDKRIEVYAFPDHSHSDFANNRSEFLIAGDGRQSALDILVDGCDVDIRNVDSQQLTVTNGEVDAEGVHLGYVSVVANSTARFADVLANYTVTDNNNSRENNPTIYATNSDFGIVNANGGDFVADMSDVGKLLGTRAANISVRRGDVGVALIENDAQFAVDGEVGSLDAAGEFTRAGVSEIVKKLRFIELAQVVCRTPGENYRKFTGAPYRIVLLKDLDDQTSETDEVSGLESTEKIGISKAKQADGVRRLLNSLDGVADEQILADLRVLSAELAQPWPEEALPEAQAPRERPDGRFELQGIRDSDLRHALAAVNAYADKIVNEETNIPVDVITLRAIIEEQRAYQYEKLLKLRDNPAYRTEDFSDTVIVKADEDHQREINNKGLVELDALITDDDAGTLPVNLIQKTYGLKGPNDMRISVITVTTHVDALPVHVYGRKVSGTDHVHDVLVVGPGDEVEKIKTHSKTDGYTSLKIKAVNVNKISLVDNASLDAEHVSIGTAIVGSNCNIVAHEGHIAALHVNGDQSMVLLTETDVGQASVMGSSALAADRSDLGEITISGDEPRVAIDGDVGRLQSYGQTVGIPKIEIDGEVGQIIKDNKDITEQSQEHYTIIEAEDKTKDK